MDMNTSLEFDFDVLEMLTMDQTLVANTIDSMADHRSDVSDANSVDSYVFEFSTANERRWLDGFF